MSLDVGMSRACGLSCCIFLSYAKEVYFVSAVGCSRSLGSLHVGMSRACGLSCCIFLSYAKEVYLVSAVGCGRSLGSLHVSKRGYFSAWSRSPFAGQSSS